MAINWFSDNLLLTDNGPLVIYCFMDLYHVPQCYMCADCRVHLENKAILRISSSEGYLTRLRRLTHGFLPRKVIWQDAKGNHMDSHQGRFYGNMLKAITRIPTKGGYMAIC